VTDLAIDAVDYAGQVAALMWPDASDDAATAPAAAGRQGLLALPSSSRPRLLVPAHNRAVAAAAARSYHVARGLRARVSTELLAGGLRTGALQLLAGSRLRMPTARVDLGGITATLREIVSPHCEIAVYVGIPRRNRKPVLLIFEPDGTLSAVAKLAVSPLASGLVRNESTALRQLGDARLTSVTVPRVLFAGQWSGHELLVQSALPALGRPPKDAERQRDEGAVEISSVGGLRHVRLRCSGVLERLLERSEALPLSDERTLIASSLAALRDRSGTVELPVGSWHGDWTPWNHAATRAGLLAWDWERFASGVPAGFDALHCAAQELAARSGQPQAALAEVRARLDPLLRPFGVIPAAQRTVFALYLLEILVRYTEDSQREAVAGGRWIEALVTHLVAVVADLERDVT
jgi:hypothetical protein